jgi:hypothetical protein
MVSRFVQNQEACAEARAIHEPLPCCIDHCRRARVRCRLSLYGSALPVAPRPEAAATDLRCLPLHLSFQTSQRSARRAAASQRYWAYVWSLSRVRAPPHRRATGQRQVACSQSPRSGIAAVTGLTGGRMRHGCRVNFCPRDCGYSYGCDTKDRHKVSDLADARERRPWG